MREGRSVAICQASIVFHEAQDRSSQKMNIVERKSAFDLEKASAIASTQQNMIVLGPHWNCLEWVKSHENSYLAFVKMPDKYRIELDDYTLHPALFDVAYSFQSSVLEGQYLPYFIGQLTINLALPEAFYSLVEIKKHLRAQGLYVFSVTILDLEDNVICMIDNLCLKQVVVLEDVT